MMRISHIAFALVIFFTGCDTSSSVKPIFENYFIKYYGEDGDQEGVDLIVNDDGSMILLGYSSTAKTSFVTKVDAVGNIIWTLPLGAANEKAVDIEIIKRGTYSGDLIVVSNVTSETLSSIRLVRISQRGSPLDSYLVALEGAANVSQFAKGITSLALEDGFIVTGSADGRFTEDAQPIYNSPDDLEDILAIKITDDFKTSTVIIKQGGEYRGAGIKVFDKQFNGSLYYFTFGYSDRPFGTNTYQYNFEVLGNSPLSLTGSLRLSSGTEDEDEIATTIIETPPSLGEGYLMVGYSVNGSANDLYLAKYNKTLESKSFEKKLAIEGVKLQTVSASVAEPAGYYVLANEISESGESDISLNKISFDASQILWRRNFGTSRGQDTGGAVATLSDGRVAIIGTIEMETQKKMALIVVNANGNLSD